MLDLDLSTIIWEIINFLVLTVALYFLVFKPMTKRLKNALLKSDKSRCADR